MSNVPRIRVAVLAAGLSLTIGAAAAPSTAFALAFTPGEQGCRDAMALGALKLANTAAKAFNACHKARSSGAKPALTDCNDATQADDAGKIADAEAQLTERVLSRCAGQSPDFLHYTSCPVPCAAQVPQIDDFNDAAACLACMVVASAETMSLNTQGNPTPPLGSPERQCHAAVGSNQTRYLGAMLKEKRRCQRNAERTGATTTDACDDGADPRGKIAAARASAKQKIQTSCATANIAALDSCTAGMAQQLADCVVAEAETHGENVFESSYALPPGSGGTTTTTTSTTITTTTSTTLPPQDPKCPEFGEVTLFAGTRGTCTTNADCAAGTCDTGLGRCHTASELDTGWTGLSHDADITDGVVVRAQLRCAGPFGGGPEPCGQCTVLGLDPSNRSCRCATDNQAICDEPFAADVDDCAGATCNCYLGPPLSLSAGNTHVCVVNRFRADITGTVNVDTGTGETTNSLASVVYLGVALTQPCPYCSGDVTFNDGTRNGTCVGGKDNGAACDVDGFNTTFPAPTGGGHSLDCFPNVGQNISGAGLKIDLNQTTGTPDPITADIPCFFNLQNCHCMVCANDASIPCDHNADCVGGAGACTRYSPGANTQPNACDNDGVCNDAGNEEGQCNVGPDDKSCDGVTRASGEGFVQCNNNADCAGSDCGVSCGNCTLVKRRECFLTSVEAQGTPDPEFPIGVSTFCISPTANQGVNATAGLPGPGRIINQQQARTYCANNPAVQYQPGVGGCP